MFSKIAEYITEKKHFERIHSRRVVLYKNRMKTKPSRQKETNEQKEFWFRTCFMCKKLYVLCNRVAVMATCADYRGPVSVSSVTECLHVSVSVHLYLRTEAFNTTFHPPTPDPPTPTQIL